MSGRVMLILATAAVSLAAGCGKPASAVFVSNEKTKALMREAQKPVQTLLAESFGTPNDLVAWRKLPVDFGEYEGVVDGKAGASPLQFQATLKPKDPKAASAPGHLKGAALLWTSGKYKDFKNPSPKGSGDYVEFKVVDYDAATGQLKVAAETPLGDGKQEPPAAGDQFIVVGSELQHGRKLYMTHCMHCHGVSGDGNGPTASYLNPRPRDYRQGKFKFTSTQQVDKACRADLERIVSQGIPGTYMPSFLLLKDDELHAIIEYVRWLALRGEFEQKVLVEIDGGGYTEAARKQRVEGGEKESEIVAALEKYVKEELPGVADTAATELAEVWNRAEEETSQIVPKKKRTPDDAASRARGRELYLSAKAKCATCHGPLGHGDGPQTEDYQAMPGSNEKYAKPGLYDDWGQSLSPRDLTRGIYRGGRRPIDIYRRIRAGIKGTPMPSFTESTLTDEETWDLVNYVLNVPYSGSVPSPGAPGNVASVSESGGN